MSTATVLIPDSIKIEKNKSFTIDSFLNLLYSNSEDIEDYLDVSKSIKNKNNKFYDFDDIVNEY